MKLSSIQIFLLIVIIVLLLSYLLFDPFAGNDLVCRTVAQAISSA